MSDAGRDNELGALQVRSGYDDPHVVLGVESQVVAGVELCVCEHTVSVLLPPIELSSGKAEPNNVTNGNSEGIWGADCL